MEREEHYNGLFVQERYVQAKQIGLICQSENKPAKYFSLGRALNLQSGESGWDIRFALVMIACQGKHACGAVHLLLHI